MNIACPNCGTTGRIDLSKRPANVNTVRCRSCQTAIPLDPPEPDASAKNGTAVTPPQTPPPFQPSSQPPPSRPAAKVISGIGTEDSAQFGGSSSPQAPPTPRSACALCHQTLPRTEMVRFGQDWVCAACKPSYVDMLQQGVNRPGELRYAGFWIRFAAKFIDGIILGVLGMIITFAFGMGTGGGSGKLVGFGFIASNLLQIIFTAGYTMYFLSRHRATPGKMACGLVVVTPEGETISAMRALGRSFAEWLSSIILLIGYIMAAFDEEKRALHDRICNTRVAYK